MKVRSDLAGLATERAVALLDGLPRATGYLVVVKPLRYRERPHLSAWTSFEDHQIVLPGTQGVEQERARSAGWVEDPLLEGIVDQLVDHALSEPVRRIVLAEVMPLIGVDDGLVEDLHDVVLDAVPVEARQPPSQGLDERRSTIDLPVLGTAPTRGPNARRLTNRPRARGGSL